MGLALDPSEEKIEVAERFIMGWVRDLWERRELNVEGFVRTDTNESSAQPDQATVVRPMFEVCQIKQGQLSVNTSAIDTFSGNSIAIRARLARLVQEHNAEFLQDEYTIGGAERARQRTAQDMAAGTPVAATPATTAPLQFLNLPISEDNILGKWDVLPGLQGVLMSNGQVALAASGTEVTVGSMSESKLIALFGSGTWGWTDQMTPENRKRGAVTAATFVVRCSL